MAYKPVENVSFNIKKHPRLLWILNRLAKAYNREVATVAGRIIEQAGTEELKQLGLD